MRKRASGFFAGVLSTVILFGIISTASATVGRVSAELDYNNIKVSLNGAPVSLTDANGNTVEPFAMNGTTYLPVRGVASALGLGVDWDQATQTVKLTSNPSHSTPNTQPPAPPAGGETMGQKNAVEKAKQYLDVLAFSYKGLVEQLEYAGFSNAEATYGADHCGADWNEQAAKKAQQYLDVMAFSRQGLIDQLKYSGFTDAQAEYGVSAVGY